jgi:hypothetical protein
MLPLLNRLPQQPAPLSQVFAVIEMIKGAKPESAPNLALTNNNQPCSQASAFHAITSFATPSPLCFSGRSLWRLHKPACWFVHPLLVALNSCLTPDCRAAEAHARSVRGEGDDEGPQLKQGQSQNVRCRSMANSACLHILMHRLLSKWFADFWLRSR